MGKSDKLSLLLIAVLDVLIVNLGYAVTFVLRYGTEVPRYNFEPYLNIVPWLSIIVLLIFYMFDLYASWRRKSIYNLIYSIALSVLSLNLVAMALTFWYRGFGFPRGVITLGIPVQVAFLTISRSIIWLAAKKFHGRKRVLIVGENTEDCLQLAEKFLGHDRGWFVIDSFLPVTELKKLEAKLQAVDVVLLRPSLKQKVEVINNCARFGKEILLVPEAYELFLLGSEPQQVDDMPVLSIQPPRLSPSQRLIKRTFDLVISFIGLLLASPFLAALYCLIPLTSPGPAFFKQERLGQDGKPYQILKLRSMVQDAEKGTGPVLAREKDPRITPLGRFIRATRLDELPQLINVIKGDMSLVGPRPERPFFIRQFQSSLPHYTYRMAVKPGITGLAQVMAKYSTTAEDKLRFDLMYIRDYSLALDLKILLQTIRVVLQGTQAAGIKQDQKDKEKLLRLLEKARY